MRQKVHRGKLLKCGAKGYRRPPVSEEIVKNVGKALFGCDRAHSKQEIPFVLKEVNAFSVSEK